MNAPTAHPPAWQRVIAVIGPVLALLIANFGTAGLAWLLVGRDVGEVTPGETVAFVIGQSVLVSAIVVGLAAGLARLSGLRLRDIGLRWTRASLGRLGLGLAVGAGVMLAVGLPLTRLGLLRPADTWDLPWWALIAAGLTQALILQGFPEELLFRGYQMTALRLRPVAALLVSSLVFGVIHLISSGGQQNALERVLYLAMPFGFAVAGGALMIVTDSLWAAVGVHAGLHLGSLVGVFLGLGEGPLLWVIGGAVYVVIGVLLLLVARRRGLLEDVWGGPMR